MCVLCVVTTKKEKEREENNVPRYAFFFNFSPPRKFSFLIEFPCLFLVARIYKGGTEGLTGGGGGRRRRRRRMKERVRKL